MANVKIWSTSRYGQCQDMVNIKIWSMSRYGQPSLMGGGTIPGRGTCDDQIVSYLHCPALLPRCFYQLK